MNERLIHEPRCNTYCEPGVHHLTSGVGYPHLHRTDLAAVCGECATPVPDPGADQAASAATNEGAT